MIFTIEESIVRKKKWPVLAADCVAFFTTEIHAFLYRRMISCADRRHFTRAQRHWPMQYKLHDTLVAAKALEATAARTGLIHRDTEPGNVETRRCRSTIQASLQ